MTKAILNPCLVALSGTLGDLVFKRSRDGEAIVARRPRKSSSRPSQAQKAQRERFREANRYARTMLAEPDLRAAYETLAAREGKDAFAAARDAYLSGRA
jgi:hypothetical protein